ncbi:MAG TPA: hypothetical protein VJT78_02770 [Candidatus Dormibacteraeota bacterium]|nr:hypothetical protein [Candidatus Dormibacteraeota bacterium]
MSVRRTTVAPLRPTILYALAVFAIGLVYRLLFIAQGWSATDEGWLQADGARVAAGQVVYRDFDYLFPPVTAVKEGLLILLLGDHWTVLASRQFFSVEVSVSSVLAFLILRRFVRDRAAFIATLPTMFFTVIVAAFTSYTLDAEFMALLSVTLAVYGGGHGRAPRSLAVLSGVAAVLAAMSKAPFLAFLFAIPFAALAGRWLRRGSGRPVHPAVRALQSGLPWYAGGVAAALAAIFAYFAAEGVLARFVFDAFILTTQSNPTTLKFKLIQDLPDYMLRDDTRVLPVLAIILVLLAVRGSRLLEVTRTLLLVAILGYVLERTLRHPPPPARPFLTIVAYGVLVVVGLVVLAVTVAVDSGWLRNRPAAEALRARLPPPEIVFLALFVQWEAQYHYGGFVFWYEGAFLSIPVVLLSLHALSRAPLVRLRPIRLEIGPPAAAAVLIGAWLATGGAGIFLERPYQDAPRRQLTAEFTTPALHGITTFPATEQRMDGLVAEVDRRTRPGDAIYVLPDFSILYRATGRRNPTRISWPDETFLTPAVVDQMVSDLERDPPQVVFIQSQREGTYLRDQPPIDWVSTKWAPIYDYLVAHYTQVGSVQDIRVMIPTTR